MNKTHKHPFRKWATPKKFITAVAATFLLQSSFAQSPSVCGTVFTSRDIEAIRSVPVVNKPAGTIAGSERWSCIATIHTSKLIVRKK